MIPINIAEHKQSVENLERKVCDYTGARYSLAVSSATSGLLMTLLLIKRDRPNAEILIPAYGFPAVCKICEIIGLKPVLVDMDYESMSMNPDDIRRNLTKNSYAIYNVETNGVIGPIYKFRSIASEFDLLLLEDSASALVQNYCGINAGRFGRIGVYSFANTKVLDSGEGGAIVTDDSNIYGMLKDLRYSNDYSSVYPLSLNFNMSHYLADRLITQFPSIYEIADDRERVHNLYKGYGLNVFEYDLVTNRYQYVMYRSKDAARISDKFKKLKIGHRYQHYAAIKETPATLKIKTETIDLPSFYKMRDSQIETICNVIKGVERGNI